MKFLAFLLFTSFLSICCTTTPEGRIPPSQWFPFELVNSHIRFPLEVRGKTVRSLLDSGANISVIDKTFAHSVGLNKSGVMEMLTLGESKRVPYISRVPYKIYGSDFPLSSAVIDLKDFGIDVIFGIDIFAATTWEIDFPKKRFRFHRRSDFVYKGPTKKIPFTNSGGQITFDLKVDGKIHQLLFDTGAGCSLMIPAGSKEIAGIKAKAIEPEYAKGAHGEKVEVFRQEVGEIEVGSYKLKGVVAEFAESSQLQAGEHGLVGIPFIEQFVVTIDMEHNGLYFELPEN